MGHFFSRQVSATEGGKDCRKAPKGKKGLIKTAKAMFREKRFFF
jgi:hypothetical protein